MKDLCNVAADAEGIEQHPVAAHEDAASIARMPKGMHEDSRLRFASVALLRHAVGVWKNRARGRVWCLRLGMTASSWEGWAKMHVHPRVAIWFYFFAAMGDILTRAYFFTGLPMHKSMGFYAVTLPQVLGITVAVAAPCLMFRLGPQIVFHRMYGLVSLCPVFTSLPLAYVGFIGALDTVPWNNRFKFHLVTLAGALFTHLHAAAGAHPGEYPVEPRTSIRKPVYRVIIQTLRVTDAMTDLSLIVELIAEVRIRSIVYASMHNTKGSRCPVFASPMVCWCCALDSGVWILDGF